jgi:beta-aspartyl-dipeptidase (metallo-type)
LAAGGRIEHLGELDRDALPAALEVETLDAAGCWVTPGLLDVHQHLTGGSGERGFASQTPPIPAGELWRGGITAVVGTLGVDTTTRTMPALLAAVKALREEGLAAWCWAGGYDARPLTGSLRDDLVLVDETLGIGELAISDRRAVELTPGELARLATDCHVAGILAGKAGVLHLHVGEGSRRLAPLRDVLERYDVEPSWLYPTHVERDEELMAEAVELTHRGMAVDVDVWERDLPRWVRFYRDHGGDPALLTASSDAGSKSPGGLLDQLRACVHDGVVELPEALALATSNPARVLRRKAIGELAPGRRADVLVIEKGSLELRHVVCAGEVVVRDGRQVRREAFLAGSDRTIELRGTDGDEQAQG